VVALKLCKSIKILGSYQLSFCAFDVRSVKLFPALGSLIDHVVVARNWFRILFDLRCKWLSFSTYTHLEATPPAPSPPKTHEAH